MKYYIPLLLIFLSSMLSAHAQIIVESADMPSAGEIIPYTTTTLLPAGVNPSLAGAAVTWDFSGLMPVIDDADTLVTVEQTPFLYQFYFNNFLLYPDYTADYAEPGFDFEIGPVAVSDTYNYFKNDDESFRNVGYGANVNGLPSSVRNIPIDVIYEFPLTYQSTSQSISASELEVPLLGYYRRDQVRDVEVEGWGTLILPSGTFEVLKVKTILNQLDSIYVESFGTGFNVPQPEQTVYEWIANDQSGPLLTIIESDGAVVSIEYRHESTVYLLEEENPVFSVYPTVVSDDLSVSSEGRLITSYAIIDTQGRVIDQQRGVHAEDLLRIGTSSLLRGSYVLSFEIEGQFYSSYFFKN